MVDLPTVANGVPSVHAPQSRVSPGQVAGPYLEFAQNLEHGAKEVGDISVLLAKEEGLKAVTRDENGDVRVERPVIVGPAALAYKDAMQTAAVVDGDNAAKDGLLKIRHEFRDDPAGFDKASQAFVKQTGQQYEKAAGPAVGLAVGRVAANTSREIHEGLLNEKERKDLSRATAAIDADIGRTTNELHAIVAGGADMNSPQVQQRLQKIGALWGQLVNNPRIAIPREKMDYEIEALKSQLVLAGADRKIAEIQRKPESEGGGVPGAMAEVERIRTDPKLNLTPGQRVAYASQLTGGVQQRINAQTQIDKNAVTAINALETTAGQGFQIPPAEMAAVEQMVIQSGNPGVAQQFHNLKTNATILQDWRKQSPAQIDQNVADFERVMEDPRVGATPQLLALRKAGLELAKSARDGIKADPNGWADRTGAVPRVPIDWAKPETMRAAIASSETAAKIYGTPVEYLRPNERAALVQVAAQGGDGMLSVAKTIVAGFGDRAPKVLAELSDGSPILAHVGSLLNTGGSAAVVRDAADSIALQNNPEALKNAPHWFRTPNDKSFNWQADILRDTYGGAFARAPDTGSAAEQTAKAAFLSRAMRQHFDPTVDSPFRTKAKETYDRALQEAAGATYTPDGVQFGGVGTYGAGASIFRPSGARVLVPGNIRSDRFGDVVGAIRDDDLGGKWQSGGRTYSVSDVQKATPVAVKGGYRFAVGDPASDNPRWIPDANGRPLTLDLDRLEPALRKRVPGAYSGEQPPEATTTRGANEFLKLINPSTNPLDIIGFIARQTTGDLLFPGERLDKYRREKKEREAKEAKE